MDMSAEIYRELGELSANVKNLSDAVTGLTTKVEALNTAQAAQKGSNRTLLTVGGGSATGGALILALLQYLSGLQHPQPAVAVQAPIFQADRPAVDDTRNR